MSCSRGFSYSVGSNHVGTSPQAYYEKNKMARTTDSRRNGSVGTSIAARTEGCSLPSMTRSDGPQFSTSAIVQRPSVFQPMES